MHGKNRQVCALAALCALLALSGTPAQDTKTTDAGPAEQFKGKTFDLPEKGKAAVTLAFPAGREATVTVKGEKKTDVHLFVFDAAGKTVAKDDSPGPDCEVKLTPKEAGKLTLEVRNLGPGANRAALKVSLGKGKAPQ
jgi:hypothetical protein